jgi:hypothetical protein
MKASPLLSKAFKNNSAKPIASRLGASYLLTHIMAGHAIYSMKNPTDKGYLRMSIVNSSYASKRRLALSRHRSASNNSGGFNYIKILEK